MKNILTALTALSLTLSPLTALAGTATGIAGDTINLEGCLVPGFADGADFSSEILIDLTPAATGLTLVGGNTYSFDFWGGVANQQMIDPNCLDNGLVTIEYNVNYALSGDSRLTFVGGFPGGILTGADLLNGVDMFFDIMVDPNLGVIDDFNADMLVVIDATLTFTETSSPVNVLN